MLDSLDSGVQNLDVDPALKADFRTQEPPDSAGFRFSPDGKSIVFVIDEAGVDNIWMQPVDGSKGRKLTNFHDSERIQDFRWSPDGKALALLRFSSVSDVILLRDTGNSSRSLNDVPALRKQRPSPKRSSSSSTGPQGTPSLGFRSYFGSDCWDS